MALPTAAAVRALVFPELVGAAEDTKLETEIAAADAVAAGHCLFPPASAGASPTLETSSYELYRDGPSPRDLRRLDLRLHPVASITTIHVDDGDDWSYDASELVSSADYVLDGLAGHVHLKPTATAAWSSGKRRIKVVCSAGYDVGATAALTQAIALIVKWWRTGARKAGPTMSSGSASGGASSTQALPLQALPEQVQALLAPYVLYERMGPG